MTLLTANSGLGVQ